jgi:hypothetical protein
MSSRIRMVMAIVKLPPTYPTCSSTKELEFSSPVLCSCCRVSSEIIQEYNRSIRKRGAKTGGAVGGR